MSAMPRVIIECKTVSQLDGMKGIYDGEERGYVRIKVDGYISAFLFLPEECRRLQ